MDATYISMSNPIAPEIVILEEPAEATEFEPLFRVVIHNDPITPMEFVVHILKTCFYLSNPQSVNIMFTAHIHGSAYVQTLAKSEAQKRVNKAHAEAHNAGYQLQLTLEPE